MRSRRTRCAFTLIELLVVLSVVSLLMAIMVPALRSARAQVRVTHCLSNMRTQGAILAQYTTEFNDRLPPRKISLTDDDEGFFAPRLIDAFLARYSGYPFGSRRPDGWRTPTGVWRCPEVGEADDSKRRTHSGILHYAPNGWLFNAVTINVLSMQTRQELPVHQGWENAQGALEWREVGTTRRPHDLVTLMDNVNFYNRDHGHWEARESYKFSYDSVYAPDPYGRGVNEGSHMDKDVRPALFLDGHAVAIPSSQEYWIDIPHLYHPGGDLSAPCFVFYEREVQRFMWFLAPGEFTPVAD